MCAMGQSSSGIPRLPSRAPARAPLPTLLDHIRETLRRDGLDAIRTFHSRNGALIEEWSRPGSPTADPEANLIFWLSHSELAGNESVGLRGPGVGIEIDTEFVLNERDEAEAISQFDAEWAAAAQSLGLRSR